jgi:hypothetical protein
MGIWLDLASLPKVGEFLVKERSGEIWLVERDEYSSGVGRPKDNGCGCCSSEIYESELVGWMPLGFLEN